MLEEYLARKYRAETRPTVDANLIKNKVAIVGIGETEFSLDSGRSELHLGCEAIKKAADDAGLKVEDIDGIVKFTLDFNDEISLANALGIRNLKFFGECDYGRTLRTSLWLCAWDYDGHESREYPLWVYLPLWLLVPDRLGGYVHKEVYA
jgi:hypothetical protein